MPAESPYPRLLDTMGRCASEDELFAELAADLRDLAGVDAAEVMLADADHALVLRASTDLPEMNNRFRLGRGKGLSGAALESGAPIFVEEGLERHPAYLPAAGLEAERFQSVAVIPIRLTAEEFAGVVTLRAAARTKFTAARKRAIGELIHAFERCLVAFRASYSTGAHTNRLGALTEVSRIISSSPYLEEILQLLVNLTAQRFDYLVCTVRLLDETRGELVLRATQALVKEYQRKRAIKLGESIAGRTIAENRTIIVPDVRTEDDYIGHELAEEQGLRSMICVPLSIQDRAVGVMSCYTHEVRDFGEDEVAALETLAKQAAFAIENAKLQVRDTLMQEMHHRVKNNLQQVASLMRLQLRHKQYKSLEEALNDTLARILAIAAVHDLLSREDLDHVGVRSIAESLVQHQIASLLQPDKRIVFDVRGENVTLSVTEATQIALVLNELILNAVEHGFDETNEGEIHITIEEKEHEIGLWVSNNGDRLPPDFDYEVAAHLGLQIVDNLVRGLNGRFKLTDILTWTVAEVKFRRAGGE